MKKQFGRCLVVIATIIIVLSLSACEIFDKAETFSDDTKNNKPLSEVKIPISPEEYDAVLASGDGYFLVSKFVETYSAAEKQIGIVDSNGIWVLELSSSNIFGEAVKTEEGQPVLTGQKTYLSYKYLGDGIFVGTLGVEFMEPGKEYSEDIGPFELVGRMAYACYFYNAKNKRSWQFGANYISPYEGDYMLASNYGYVNGESKNYGSDDWYFIVDKEGHITDLNLERTSSFSPLSDGLFLNDGVFYNIKGVPVLSVREYDLVNPQATCFINGKCEIKFKNPAGNEYVAVIDKNGNFVKEPEKCN